MSEEEKKVNLKETGEIELPQIDVTKYVGKKVNIVDVGEYEGKFGFYVKMKAEVLETIGQGDKQTDLQPSRIFSLQTDEQGKVGWGKQTQLGEFLAKHKAAQYNDMLGKEVVVQTRLKDGVEYLTF